MSILIRRSLASVHLPVWSLRLAGLVRRFVIQFVRDDALGLSGELAYRFFLSIFPFFIVLASLGSPLAGLLGWLKPAQNVAQILGQIMPPDASGVFSTEIEHIVQSMRPGLLPLSVIGALLIATSGTNAVIKAANRAYGVEETRPFWKRYLTALGLTVFAGIAIVGAFVLFMLGIWFGVGLASTLGLGPVFQRLVQVLFWPIVGVMLVAGISYVYWAAPNVRLHFLWVLPGAIVFSVSWLVATRIFAFYVAQLGSHGLTYGALAGVAILLLWFYLTAFLLLVGLELNVVVAERLDPDGIAAQQERTRASAAVVQLPPRVAGTMTPRRPN